MRAEGQRLFAGAEWIRTLGSDSGTAGRQPVVMKTITQSRRQEVSEMALPVRIHSAPAEQSRIPDAVRGEFGVGLP